MITVINQKTWKSYNCSKTDAGRIIGVTRKTIADWIKAGKKYEQFNYFLVVFDCEVVKQHKGFTKNNQFTLSKDSIETIKSNTLITV